MGIDGLDGFYELRKTVGSGGFAKVKLAIHNITGEKVAIKIMKKSALGEDLHRVKLELEALKVLDHPNICKLYEVIETSTHFFLVIEYCSKGELFDRIVECKRLSEHDSRAYFRQIVSAVAHIHSHGFVHRDLKPENVLLDRHEQLKLIDFGLCARPSGGVQCFLDTSCGSPSYAAPELVLGKKYLGTEVDIWSLGVLLYALLCGSLPFDDVQLQKLYSKILSGRYEEPEWLSTPSKQLIRQMLQIDPAKRITVKKLQCHPWLTAGGSVTSHTKQLSPRSFDAECVAILAGHHSVSVSVMWKRLQTCRYDHDTATYMLLMERKMRGGPPKIIYPARTLFRSRAENDLRKPIAQSSPLETRRQTFIVTKDASDSMSEAKIDKENVMSPPRKPTKRHHSPEPSVVPAKMSTPTSERRRDTLATRSPMTPRGESPRGSARKMFERGLNRVRYVLTPRRRQAGGATSPAAGPAVFAPKGLCNVSTTSSMDPEYVLNKLMEALRSKDITVKRKGYVLRGKQDSSVGVGRPKLSKLSFELEVCLIQQAEGEKIVGIKRKRLRGDSWCYRKVCEEVLAASEAPAMMAQSTLV